MPGTGIYFGHRKKQLVYGNLSKDLNHRLGHLPLENLIYLFIYYL